MDVREKLVELIRDGRYKAEAICNENNDCQSCTISDPVGHCKYGCIADHLIANGVTIQPLTDCKQPVTDNNVGGKWIPVTERLPVMHKLRYEDCVEPTGYGECFVSDHVLAYCPSGRKFLVVECSRSEENGPLYWTEVTSDITVRPTNWMPLPEPPKGE